SLHDALPILLGPPERGEGELPALPGQDALAEVEAPQCVGHSSTAAAVVSMVPLVLMLMLLLVAIAGVRLGLGRLGSIRLLLDLGGRLGRLGGRLMAAP